MEFDKNKIKIGVVGLGYVGLPLSIAFSKKYPVVGFDISKTRVDEISKGYDRTGELTSQEILSDASIIFSCQESSLSDVNVFIITVPTPVDSKNIPNLTPLKSASELVGENIKKNDIIIYESTVFPGCTEEECVPILEKFSGFTFNKDFFCGYSPERINPGDKVHTLQNIKKIVSGSNSETLEFVDALYKSIIPAGTYRASSLSVAEAAKIIENTQRDVNIALINELSIIFNKLNLDTSEVLEAAETKWNFLPFRPGLVGGHCIGVDPYYLTYKATETGHHAEIILSGRKINDNMGSFIVENAVSEITKQGIAPLNAKVAVLGLTFKENCPDLRNSKVFSIIEKLKQYGCEIIVSDPVADPNEVYKKYNIQLKPLNDIYHQDAIIIAVAHESYKIFKNSEWGKMLNAKGVLIDVKSLYNKNTFDNTQIRHWRL